MAAEIIRLSETYFLVSWKLVQIDACEAHRLLDTPWYILNSGYIARSYWEDGKLHNELLHRTLARAQKGCVVDHIDGDKLNNRLSNLRICTHSENMRNRKMSFSNISGLKGVEPTKSGTFRATIRVNKVIHRLGTFATAEAAHAAYCEASARLHGEFARTA